MQNVPEAALGADAKILKNEPDASLILDIDQTKGTGSQATDKVSGKHALRLATADGHTLRHGAKLVVIDSRGGMPIGRGHELTKALQIRPEFLGVVLIRRLVAGSVGRYESR